ncbi:MAG: B12-binding domain-containing radical SAM protein [Kiritimatiellia bacterium]
MILFLTPPFVQLNTPYPATPSLVGFLSSRGYDCTQRDLSIEVALKVLRTYGDEFTDEAIEILQNPHLPDEAKTEMTAYVDELAVWIRDNVDPDFGFSRYAERLGVAVPDFGLILNRLRRRSPIDRILDDRVAALLEEVRPDVVGVTCPFPGTLLGAFRIARAVRRLAPQVRLVLGGGYVNTELREMDDPRVGRFFDVVMYDEGYEPWLEFLSSVHPPAQPSARPSIPPFVKPSYEGLDLSLYMDLPESENPMLRLWSTGRWLKIQMARGCYWHKCAFCDVTLDYIKCFQMPDAVTIVDAMESLAHETRQDGGGARLPGFHFTDEAMPPALIARVCHEILRRKFKCRWWGNVRFDAAFTPKLARLMARAGCMAVTGGLECAVDRLLKLMNKGITLASARAALTAFREAGILVHAYLMYGFPTQTEREAVAALGHVRRFFREGLVQSAFFHRFALTVHSPIAKDPARFGIKVGRIRATPHRVFARNEIPFEEPGAPDWDRIGKGLKLALYNYMRGAGYSKPLSFWFSH